MDAKGTVVRQREVSNPKASLSSRDNFSARASGRQLEGEALKVASWSPGQKRRPIRSFADQARKKAMLFSRRGGKSPFESLKPQF